MRVSASGGPVETLTKPDGGALGYAHMWPRALPSGHSVLFTVWGKSNYGLAILSLDCRRELPLDRSGIWQRPELWPHTLIAMTLDRVGAAAGPDLALLGRLRALAPDRSWIGAGGIRDATDLQAAAAAGARAWLVASALHDGTLH